MSRMAFSSRYGVRWIVLVLAVVGRIRKLNQISSLVLATTRFVALKRARLAEEPTETALPTVGVSPKPLMLAVLKLRPVTIVAPGAPEMEGLTPVVSVFPQSPLA